jgi:ankyrin repeat protein
MIAAVATSLHLMLQPAPEKRSQFYDATAPSVLARSETPMTALDRQMMAAAANDENGRVLALLERGADLNARDAYGRSALSFAVGRLERPPAPWTIDPLRGEAADDQAGYALRLLSLGADPNVTGRYQNGPCLTEAISYGYGPLARALVLFGADVNARTPYSRHNFFTVGDTPLMEALGWADVRMSRFLLEHGARLDVANARGKTPLMIAAGGSHAENVKCVRLLLERGASRTVNARDRKGRTALIKAAAAGAPEIVRLLLAAGALPDLKDNEGKTALDASLEGLSYGDPADARRRQTAVAAVLRDVARQ